jgi:hypothetical protein
MFEFSGGTVLGRDHLKNGYNNQDAFHIEKSGDIVAIVVCDGCGDKTVADFSEVGAQITARLLSHTIVEYAKSYLQNGNLNPDDSAYFWESIRANALTNIKFLCHQMGENLFEIVSKYFLFTTLAVLITPKWTEFVSIGDGVIFVNGEETKIGPFPNNMPPYLGYALLKTSIDPNLIRFQIQKSLPTSEVSSFVVGTDGLFDLIMAENSIIPITKEFVGPISQFWEKDFFSNPYALNRRLRVINKDRQTLDFEKGRINLQPGLLHDDTTFVVGRRKEE